MEALKRYMVNLSPSEKKDFATRCGTTLNYLRKVMSTGQKIGPELCVQIEKQSSGAVSRQLLSPTNWREIWPELNKGNATDHA